MTIGIVLAATPGYSETFFRSKIMGLKKSGHQVIVFTQTRDRDFDLCPVRLAPKVYANSFQQTLVVLWVFLTLLPFILKAQKLACYQRKDGSSWFHSIKSVYLNAHLLKSRLDWLHFGFATQALGREFVASAIGAKMAVSFRGFDINVYPLKHANCYALLWKQVDQVHSISNYLLEKAYAMGLSPKVPHQIITPAIDRSHIPAYNLAEGSENRWVTIARFNWIKGLDIAFHALSKLKQKGIPFTYVIIGDGEQKELERYQYLAYQLNIQAEVQFAGRLSHQETLVQLQKASLYIQPSLNEGFCNAVLEAQAMGIPTLASKAGGLPENLLDGRTGWLFETGNPNELALLIEKVLNLSADEKRAVTRAAKSRAESNFAIEQQQNSFIKFYSP